MLTVIIGFIFTRTSTPILASVLLFGSFSVSSDCGNWKQQQLDMQLTCSMTYDNARSNRNYWKKMLASKGKTTVELAKRDYPKVQDPEEDLSPQVPLT